jgi:phage terminase large subunit-like protein
MYSAEKPERLRGPNHDAAWCDELASWFRLDDTWSNLQFTLRAGKHPQRFITTTPKPRGLIRELIKDPVTLIVKGSTFDNIENLSPAFIAEMRLKYEGTRLGRQELHAEILDDTPGALWTWDMIESAYVQSAPDMERIVVSIDPAAIGGEGQNEHGIMVNGKGCNGRYYLLADISCHGSPDTWGRAAIRAYDYWKGDKIVAEVNNGGEMVKHVLYTTAAAMCRSGERRTAELSYEKVTATRGKDVRAEPVAALYEQKRVSHVGRFERLEEQLCSYVPGPRKNNTSPDRLDAHVWGITELMAPSYVSYAGALAL